jgi:hypothetical protein
VIEIVSKLGTENVRKLRPGVLSKIFAALDEENITKNFFEGIDKAEFRKLRDFLLKYAHDKGIASHFLEN